MKLTDLAMRDPSAVARLYAAEQAAEINARVKRLVDRLVPWDLSRPFMVACREQWARYLVERITARVERRDADLMPIDMAERMERRSK